MYTQVRMTKLLVCTQREIDVHRSESTSSTNRAPPIKRRERERERMHARMVAALLQAAGACAAAAHHLRRLHRRRSLACVARVHVNVHQRPRHQSDGPGRKSRRRPRWTATASRSPPRGQTHYSSCPSMSAGESAWKRKSTGVIVTPPSSATCSTSKRNSRLRLVDTAGWSASKTPSSPSAVVITGDHTWQDMEPEWGDGTMVTRPGRLPPSARKLRCSTGFTAYAFKRVSHEPLL